jgi:hypothetical protein
MPVDRRISAMRQSSVVASRSDRAGFLPSDAASVSCFAPFEERGGPSSSAPVAALKVERREWKSLIRN